MYLDPVKVSVPQLDLSLSCPPLVIRFVYSESLPLDCGSSAVSQHGRHGSWYSARVARVAPSYKPRGPSCYPCTVQHHVGRNLAISFRHLYLRRTNQDVVRTASIKPHLFTGMTGP